jgi:RimJ/RimL family protein N-acetyltransferase
MIKYKPHAKTDLAYRVIWLNNPKVNVHLRGEVKGATLKTETEWFARYKKDKSKKFFTIYYKQIRIGLVGLTHIDKKAKKAELFIMIGEDAFRGIGLGKLSVQFIVDYAFKKLKLNKVSLAVFKENVVAIKTYKSVGFKNEGLLKDEAFYRGKYHDLVLMAIFNK